MLLGLYVSGVLYSRSSYVPKAPCFGALCSRSSLFPEVNALRSQSSTFPKAKLRNPEAMFQKLHVPSAPRSRALRSRSSTIPEFFVPEALHRRSDTFPELYGSVALCSRGSAFQERYDSEDNVATALCSKSSMIQKKGYVPGPLCSKCSKFAEQDLRFDL